MLELETKLSGKNDKKNAILEVHSGAGGTESCDWADMLLRMYLRWCDKKNFKYEILDTLPGEEAGIKKVIVLVKGLNAYGYLKCERGVHRLVRLSPFDSQNRRHTSFAAVEVIPEENDDINIEIKDSDIRVDVYRSSGAGGQGVNTTDSAVRITYLPTNTVVTCQNERSQLKNKEQAMVVLKSKLYALEEQKKLEESEEYKKGQSSINFGSQIRSYVMHPYSMVKDHRTNYETSNVSKVLDDIQNGDMEVERQEQSKIPVDEIRPNPYQPRKVFNDEALKELSSSIKQHGVFTPILVKKSIQGYDLIAGERRLRASKLAGLKDIPAIIVDFDDQEMMEIALLENIQREDLNVIEEAKAYEKLIQRLGYTQEQLAHRVGKSREHITNLLRLLKLPEDVQEYVVSKQLSMGHVRALLGLKTEANMRKVAKQAIDQGLSVRKVEQIVKDTNNKKTIEKPKEDIYVKAAKEKLQEFFQTSVSISKNAISIHYENKEDLNRVLELLNLVEEE